MSAYRFSSDANFGIAKICFDLLEVSPLAADRFLDALEATCELLEQHPLIGRSRPELGEDLRSFPVGNYLIFYVPASDGIAIARVIYGGRDLPTVFRPQ